MVKVILSFFLIVSTFFGDVIDDKIKSFIGEKKFYSSKKIIDILLGDKRGYYITDDKIDIIKLLKVLKKNGFIRQDLKSVKNVEVTFSTHTSSLLFLKIIGNALNSMGFNFYITKSMYKNADDLSWTIVMNTEYLIDPVVFSNELKRYNCFIDDIIKDSVTKWHYNISSNKASLPGKILSVEATYKLPKPIKSYWLKVNSDAKVIDITSYTLNRWHPYVMFLDNGLKVLSVYNDDKIEKSLKLDIPITTRYIVIDDKYTISNIRVGLKIYLQKDR